MSKRAVLGGALFGSAKRTMYDDNSVESFGVERKGIPGPGTYAPKLLTKPGSDPNFGSTPSAAGKIAGGRFGTSRRAQLGSTTPQDLAVRHATDNQLEIGGKDMFAGAYSSFQRASVKKKSTQVGVENRIE